MRTGAWWVRSGMVAALATVFGVAWLDLRRNQQRAFDDFVAVQSALAREAAAAVAARIDGIVGGLAAAAWAGAESPRAAEQVLRRILQREGRRPAYREVDLFDGGRPSVELPDAASVPIARLLAVAAVRASLVADLERAPEGQPIISPLVRIGEGPDDGSRVRLYGIREGRLVVVLAVEMTWIFDGIGSAQATQARWLAYDRMDPGPRGRWLALKEGAAPRWIDVQQDARPALAPLMASLSRGEQGAIEVPSVAASALGIDPRIAVVGFAPVRVGTLTPWSIAVAASAQRLRDRSHLHLWRLATSTGLTALVMGLFGVLLARQDRRASALAERLRLAAATAALRERSQKIVESIPVGVMAVTHSADSSERVTAVNPYLAERGLTAGGNLANALPHADAEVLATLRAVLADARTARRASEHVSLRLRLGDGEPRDVDASAVPLLQPLADADCFLLLHDRTEVRALERSLVRAEKLGTIGTLAAGVAHEVGTPLGIISGRAEQMLARLPPGEAGEAERRGLASILAQVEKVSSTIRQLLDFARQRPVEARVVAPRAALDSAAALLEHRFARAGVLLSIDVPDRVAPVAADAGQIEQVFVNLLLNACDACGAGGSVATRAFERDGHVVFEVADTGAGIAPEHLPHVFDPFFTTKKRGHGTGLGLTIAADVVKNHGGAIEIDSTLGRGTVVRVLLPRSDQPTREEHG